MPKKRASLASDFEVFISDWTPVIAKWQRKRKSRSKTLGENELFWLARCAVQPFFLSCPDGSIGSAFFHDSLSSRERADRLAALFAEFPDELGEFWVFARGEKLRMFSSSEDNPGARTATARKAVKEIEALHQLKASGARKEDWLTWIKKAFKEKHDTHQANDEVETLFQELNRLPAGGWQAGDIERYLEDRYGGNWRSAVEDAIRLERGVSGKKMRKKP